MNPDKVVVHVVNRDRRDVVLDPLRERIGESREPANLHPHHQVLALDIRRADVLRVGVADERFLLASDAFRRTILSCARSAFIDRSAVTFNQGRVVHFIAESSRDGMEVYPQAIGGQLHAIGESALEILVHGDPSPNVPGVGIGSGQSGCDVLLFGRCGVLGFDRRGVGLRSFATLTGSGSV